MPKQILEGSNAIARAVNMARPDVVSAYPITPQTHIVEDLAKIKASGQADFEYVRAESEFAAASIVAGASAAGARTYTATSSQGLLLMIEVLYNIAGMRLPIVMTCANRGVSAPITIWNDHQDAMAARDTGWIMLFSENHQEAVEHHLTAFRLAEALRLPVMVNVDGFILTHTYEPVELPLPAEARRFVGAWKPKAGSYLDPGKPFTMGAFAAPNYYLEIRKELHDDLNAAQDMVNSLAAEYRKTLPRLTAAPAKGVIEENGLYEYYGEPKAKTVVIAMGSVAGTIKEVVDTMNAKKSWFGNDKYALIRLKSFRPFPSEQLERLTAGAGTVIVIEKAISLGSSGPLGLEVSAALAGNKNTRVVDFSAGLGGRDITQDTIREAFAKAGATARHDFLGVKKAE